jgi:hypothetical protein
MSLPKQIADDLAKLQADLAALFPDQPGTGSVPGQTVTEDQPYSVTTRAIGRAIAFISLGDALISVFRRLKACKHELNESATRRRPNGVTAERRRCTGIAMMTIPCSGSYCSGWSY